MLTPWLEDADVRLYHGDVLQVLRELPAESVDCCVTSPPYWGLRSYLADGHEDKPLELGLEPTPEEYVTRMVEVFREVRRVLAPHGTVWINLGDSYVPASWSNRSQPQRNGLKPKDLVGIPWMVARALQAPYYTGKIKDERDRIWLAAVIEAEGCMFIHKRKVGQSNGQGYERKSDSYGAGLEVSSTDRVIVERCMEITGLGSICEQTPTQNARRKQTIYRWNLRSNVCRDVIRELYPHFIAKQHEARLLLGCPSSGEDAARAHESLKALHQGGTPDIDFAAPASMFEGGWYLRSDIIWSKKPNPMPESVTDRPTKAHEYVFLLSKQPRYFFDQEAVREAVSPFSDFRKSDRTTPYGEAIGKAEGLGNGSRGDPSGRNIRSVWEIATQPYPEAHFATFPEELARRCIAAGTSERGKCWRCGKPWERDLERTPMVIDRSERTHEKGRTRSSGTMVEPAKAITKGWVCPCTCDLGHFKDDWPETKPCVVLDPFMGSGTVAHVARKLGRHAVGIDLNESYLELAARRLQQQSLFAESHG